MKSDHFREGKIVLIVISICVAVIYFLLLDKENFNTVKIATFTQGNWKIENKPTYKLYERSIEIYIKEHPGIIINWQTGIMEEDYLNWLYSKILLGNEPDLFLVDGRTLVELANKGAILNLEKYIQLADDIDTSYFYSCALNEGVVNGHQYGLPFFSQPRLMAVNLTLLKLRGLKRPTNDWNWQKFHKICRLITQDINGDGIIDRYGVTGYTWKDVVYSNNGYIINKDNLQHKVTKRTFTNSIHHLYLSNILNQGYTVRECDSQKENVGFSEGIMNYYGASSYTGNSSDSEYFKNEEKSQPKVTERNFSNSIQYLYAINVLNQRNIISEQDFQKGNVAFMPMDYSTYKIYSTYPGKLEKYNGFKWICLAMPAGPDGDNISQVDTYFWVISSQSKMKQEAFEMMKILTYNREIQQGIYRYTNNVSPLKVKEYLDQHLTKDSELIDLVMEKGRYPSNVPAYENCLKIIQEEIDSVMNDDINIQVALFHIEKKIKALYE